MNLRQRLLDLLSSTGYRPADEAGLARTLRLKKTLRGPLVQEVRRLLDTGEAVRERNGAVRLRPSLHPVPRGVFKPKARAEPAARPAPKGRPRKAEAPRVEADATGRIQFRSGGSAYVVREGEETSTPSIQISATDTGTALPGDRVAVKLHRNRRGRYAGEAVGEVIRVLERTRETVVGELRRQHRNFIVAADDPRFPCEVQVPDPAKSGLKPVPQPGDKVVVRLAPWDNPRRPLTGEVTSRLGRTFEPAAELQGLLAKYELDPQFPAEVRQEVGRLPDQVRPGELAHRKDYRDAFVFTIDPDDAKDFDDALSLESLDDGGARVGIHIADVSTYVKPGTGLDREARRRGNSTYLVGQVIPMLPEKLSNGLCSLVEAQDRLCKAVFLTFDVRGHLRDTAFANTVIRSRKRLTYHQAYALLFENDLEKIRALPLPPKHQTGSTGRALSSLPDLELVDLQNAIRKLWTIASKLRRDRMAHGSLDLDMPETKIFVDPQGFADRLEKIEQDESHQLIEEFMLAANEAVARLTRTQRLPSLYRVHDEPDPERLAELRQVLAAHQIQVGDLTLRSEVVKLLELLRTHPQGHTLRTELLRSLRKACYRAKPDGHYGLHKKDYTHFTSPIRRYADLVVHRVIEGHLDPRRKPSRGAQSGAQRMEELAGHLSLTEIASTEAERESVKIKLLEFFEREMHKKPKTPFAAVITDIRQTGFFIELVESLTFGLVPMSVLRDDIYHPNHARTALIGRRHHRKFEMNGRLDVVVHQVDRYRRTIDFRPA